MYNKLPLPSYYIVSLSQTSSAFIFLNYENWNCYPHMKIQTVLTVLTALSSEIKYLPQVPLIPAAHFLDLFWATMSVHPCRRWNCASVVKAEMGRDLRALTPQFHLAEMHTYWIFYPCVQIRSVDTTESLVYGRCYQGSESANTEFIKADIFFFLGESDLSRGPFKETEVAAGVPLRGGRSKLSATEGPFART